MKFFSFEDLDNSATELPEGTDLTEQSDPQLPAPEDDESKFHEDLITELENEPTADRLAEISEVVEEITEDLPALESEFKRLTNTIMAMEELREELAHVADDPELTDAELARLQTVDQFVTIQSVDSEEEELVESAVQGDAVLFPSTESFKQGGRKLALETLDRTLKAAMESQVSMEAEIFQKAKLRVLSMFGMQEKWTNARTPIEVDRTKANFTAQFRLELGTAATAGYKIANMADLTRYVQALTLQTKSEQEAWARNLNRISQIPIFIKNLLSGKDEIAEVAKTFVDIGEELTHIKPGLVKMSNGYQHTLPYFTKRVGFVKVPKSTDFTSPEGVKAAVNGTYFGIMNVKPARGASMGPNIKFDNVSAKDVQAFVKAVEEYIAVSATSKNWFVEYNKATGLLRTTTAMMVRTNAWLQLPALILESKSRAIAISNKTLHYAYGFEPGMRGQQFSAAIALDKIARQLAK